MELAYPLDFTQGEPFAGSTYRPPKGRVYAFDTVPKNQHPTHRGDSRVLGWGVRPGPCASLGHCGPDALRNPFASDLERAATRVHPWTRHGRLVSDRARVPLVIPWSRVVAGCRKPLTEPGDDLGDRDRGHLEQTGGPGPAGPVDPASPLAGTATCPPVGCRHQSHNYLRAGPHSEHSGPHSGGGRWDDRAGVFPCGTESYSFRDTSQSAPG